MEHAVETFDVSESTSSAKRVDLNTSNYEDKILLSNKSKGGASMYDAESQSSGSPMYEEYLDFDPSNFRLTPHSTISPKREACLSSEFKSVDSYDSFMVLSVIDSDEFFDDKDVGTYNLQEELVVDNNDQDDDLIVIENLMSQDNDKFQEVHEADMPKLNKRVLDVKKSEELVEEIDIDVDTDKNKELNERKRELNAGNVSFDISSNCVSKENCLDKVVNVSERSEHRDSLDSERIINYLKNEKVSEICKKLKADLIGTKKHNVQELPLTDELPFSERVYNYISDLRAFSSISSNEAPSSRLSSIDFKPLQTADTQASEERVKDFEEELEPVDSQLYVSSEFEGLTSELKEVSKNKSVQKAQILKEYEMEEDREEVEKEMVESTRYLRESSFEMDLKSLQYPTRQQRFNNENREGTEMMVESDECNGNDGKREEELDRKREDQMDTSEFMDEDKVQEVFVTGTHNKDDKVNNINDVNYKGNSNNHVELSYGKKDDDEYEFVYKAQNGRRVKDGKECMVDESSGVCNGDYLNELERYNSFEQLNLMSKYGSSDGMKVISEGMKGMNEVGFEDRATTDRFVDDGVSSLVSVERGGCEAESWEGLDCMLSSYGVNLVYSCLRSVKVMVGENLHEYDVYTGTKKLMMEFLELLKRVNELERKLRSEFISLEKNDYNLEVTRNSYLSLTKTNSRLKGLLSYYRSYERLQRDSIKLKSENIATTRSEILSKLSQFQEVSKMSETKEALSSLEKNMVTSYNQTGFFILPLQNDSYHNFVYLINYNYYTHHAKSSRTLRDGNTQRELGSDPGLRAEMLEKLRVLERLPYKPRKTEPDMELKLFMYFESYTTTSSDQYVVTTTNMSNSSKSSYELLGAKKRLSNGDMKEVLSSRANMGDSSRGGSGVHGTRDVFSEINMNIDQNMTIDLYTLKNDLRLVLYAPQHKDTPYYRFKGDLVIYYNGMLNEEFNEYLEDQNEALELKEVLKKVLELSRELNGKFVNNLRQFRELIKLSTNYDYSSQSKQQFRAEEGAEYNVNSALSRENSSEDGMQCGDGGKLKREAREKSKALKLMLTFKNNMPCLWCKICFNFNKKNTKMLKPSSYNMVNKENRANKNNIVSSIKLEFVHPLNKEYLRKYEEQLKKMNKLASVMEKDVNIVEHLKTTLNSQQFYM